MVVVDPPAHAHLEALLARSPAGGGPGWAHLAWGEDELRFALRVHEWDLALRAPLTTVYRALRGVGRVADEALEAVLRGDGPQPRSPALAGRLVRVLAELGLVRVERQGLALSVVEASERTTLERSAAYRAYERRLEDGRRYLTTSGIRAAA